VNRLVARVADRKQIPICVIPAVRAENDVMSVEVLPASAVRDLAFPVVTFKDVVTERKIFTFGEF
jgi:hypothetical protein